MRIAVTGASGTGKTTLAKIISEKYGWPVCPVGARSVAATMGFSSPYDVDAVGKRAEFQFRLFTEKYEWENANKHFVTDRTHFDNLVYTAMHGAAQSIDVDKYIVAMLQYDCTFICPVYIFQKLGTDPTRMHDTAYHRVYDIFLRGLLDEHNITMDIMDMNTIEGRKRYVITYIDRLLSRAK